MLFTSKKKVLVTPQKQMLQHRRYFQHWQICYLQNSYYNQQEGLISNSKDIIHNTEGVVYNRGVIYNTEGVSYNM